MNNRCEDIQITDELSRAGLELLEDTDGLYLFADGMKVRADFQDVARRVSSGSLKKELLVKAAKVHSDREYPIAIDATAGFGEDSMLLAAAGFEVYLYECNPVISLLLEDGIKHAKEDCVLADAASRMHVHQEDSVKALYSLQFIPDVVYLDPMFPARKKSAAVKKKFQLIHRLETPCEDEKQLLDAAIQAHPHKIIIKRPLNGSYLADVKPAYSTRGKAIRYDCIVL